MDMKAEREREGVKIIHRERGRVIDFGLHDVVGFVCCLCGLD